jgi:hypothetical protein
MSRNTWASPALALPAVSPVGRCQRSLLAGQSLSLHSANKAELRINGGSAWITLGIGLVGAPNELGDRFLSAGERLQVPAGARLVVEPLLPQAEPLRLEWCEDRGALGRWAQALRA